MNTSAGAPVMTTAPTVGSPSSSRTSSSSSLTMAPFMKFRGGLSSATTITRPARSTNTVLGSGVN
jgi:hypothetical protein